MTFDDIVYSFGTCIGDPYFRPIADVNADGCVDIIDYSLWRASAPFVRGR